MLLDSQTASGVSGSPAAQQSADNKGHTKWLTVDRNEHYNSLISHISLPTASGVLREAQYRLSSKCRPMKQWSRTADYTAISDVTETAMVYIG